MSYLRILKLDGMRISRNLSGLSNELQYLGWRNYPYTTKLLHPFTYSPLMFQMDRLVELLMPRCNSKQLWKGIEVKLSFNVLFYTVSSKSKQKIKWTIWLISIYITFANWCHYSRIVERNELIDASLQLPMTQRLIIYQILLYFRLVSLF